ncbi:MAG: ISAzo13 family transposase, partial [Actinobacteria bacterium]|nr:ISAzo13 family transposase [Actinomycetota bacterium]
ADTDPKVLKDLERIAGEDGRGDPQSPLRWCSKSHAKLAGGLRALGHSVSARTVAPLLVMLGWSLQANAKTREGRQHPDRDAQFRYINDQVAGALAAKQPAISVDTKKKELVGDFKNAGRELAPKGTPTRVRTHDFIDKQLGKVAPYGVYDMANDEGFVSVGVSNDTAQFSAASILAWWRQLGAERFPAAVRLLITADCGGSNGNRTRLWKVELQKLADLTGMAISVCHFPPGTSKWNRIEHRLFSHISINWRGKPLTSHQVIINLIAATTTRSGLTVHARLDDTQYPKGLKVTDAELAAVSLQGHDFHPEWNYTISPRPTPPAAGAAPHRAQHAAAR